MAQKIDLIYHDPVSKKLRANVKAAFTANAQDEPIRYAAHEWRRRMIRRTPKRWTGQVRKGWTVRQLGQGVYELTNTSKVMGYLEMGTPAHGPVKAKRLFIPLTRRAAEAGARGVMAANAVARAEGQWKNYGSKVSGKKKKVKFPFVYGKDFVFAKRVRGIKAMRIVRDARVDAQRTLKVSMRRWIRNRLFR